MRKVIRILKCECAPRMLVKDSNGKFNGESAPLWQNSTGSCYIVQSALAILAFGGVLTAYILKIDSLKEECKISFKPLIIAQLAILVVSALIDYRLNDVKYASDETWFKVIIVICFQLLLLVVVGGLAMFFGMQTYLKAPGYVCVKSTTVNKKTTSSNLDALTSEIWQAAFAVSLVVCLLVLAKIVSLIILIFNLYGNSAKFLVVAKLPKKSDIQD